MVAQPAPGERTTTVKARIQKAIGSQTKRILVTGGTGFIGGRIASAFADAGHDITVIGRNRYNCPSNCNFVRADLRNRQQLEQACACLLYTSPSPRDS